MTTTKNATPVAASSTSTTGNPPAPWVVENAVRDGLDNVVETVATAEQVWAATDLAGRVHLLTRLHNCVAAQSEAWVAAAVRAKNLDPDSPLVGEEYLSGPYAVLSGIDALRESLSALAAGRSPIEGVEFGSAPGAGSRCPSCRTRHTTGCCSAASPPTSGSLPA